MIFNGPSVLCVFWNRGIQNIVNLAVFSVLKLGLLAVWLFFAHAVSGREGCSRVHYFGRSEFKYRFVDRLHRLAYSL